MEMNQGAMNANQKVISEMLVEMAKSREPTIIKIPEVQVIENEKKEVQGGGGRSGRFFDFLLTGAEIVFNQYAQVNPKV